MTGESAPLSVGQGGRDTRAYAQILVMDAGAVTPTTDRVYVFSAHMANSKDTQRTEGMRNAETAAGFPSGRGRLPKTVRGTGCR